jgi:outer membrane protein assembly factor BamB
MGHRLSAGVGLALGLSTVLTAAPAAPDNWPSFRGTAAAGVAAAAAPPATWDLAAGRNVVWSAAVPGLGHSSPVVWGDRVFVTSALTVDKAGAGTTETGVAQERGDPAAGARRSWRTYCLDRATGRILWERTAFEGAPRVKHHAKASHASATPVTDGRYVVTMMGSEGLYTYDMDGRLIWKHDLGRLNQGYVDDQAEEWGPASSPILHGDVVIVQNDRHADSYLAAFDAATGRERWRVSRDEMPSWATPAIIPGTSPTIVTNSPRFIRGHDAATGRELWRVADGAQVKVPTPIVAGDLVIVTGGWPNGGQPIYAIRAATGEVAWKLPKGSPYTPTPIVYDGVLYVCIDTGVLSAYDVATGRRIYQQRIAPDAGGFSASPVAAAGRLYFASEDGVVFVVRAGRKFELIARNDMRAMCLATPALSGDMLLVRTRTHVHALRESPAAAAP